jgi:hypothetical protein
MRLHRYTAFLATCCLTAAILAATAAPASAIIPDCLPSPGVEPCITFSPFLSGRAALTWDASLRTNRPEGPVVIAPLESDDAYQDFHAVYEGTVLQAYRASQVSAFLALYFGPSRLYEFQYSDAAANLCLGVGAGHPVPGTPLDMQACGNSPETLWLIPDDLAVKVFMSATGDGRNALQAMSVQRGRDPGAVVITTSYEPFGLAPLSPAQLWDVQPSS